MGVTRCHFACVERVCLPCLTMIQESSEAEPPNVLPCLCLCPLDSLPGVWPTISYKAKCTFRSSALTWNIVGTYTDPLWASGQEGKKARPSPTLDYEEEHLYKRQAKIETTEKALEDSDDNRFLFRLICSALFFFSPACSTRISICQGQQGSISALVHYFFLTLCLIYLLCLFLLERRLSLPPGFLFITKFWTGSLDFAYRREDCHWSRRRHVRKEKKCPRFASFFSPHPRVPSCIVTPEIGKCWHVYKRVCWSVVFDQYMISERKNYHNRP
jgi:hypothetical protein